MATIMTTETALFDPYLVAEYDPYGGGADKAEEECIEIPDEEDEGEYGEDQPDESAEVAPKELEDPSSTWQVEEDTLPLQPDGFDEPRQLLEEDTLPEEAVTLEVYEEAEELMEEAAEVGEAADGLVYEEAGEEPQEEAEEEALVQYGDADVDEAGGLLAETAEEDLQVQAEAEEPSEPFGEAEEPQPPGEGGEEPASFDIQDGDCGFEEPIAGDASSKPLRSSTEAPKPKPMPKRYPLRRPQLPAEDLALALGDFEAELEPMSEDDETEPVWLRGDGIEVPDPKVAEDAEVCAAFLDGLTGGDVELDMAFPQYVPNLARYLVGHPEALVSKKRKGHKKGAGKRYFGAEERSEDVMADKVIVGCWVCGKLDHESQDCVFKRCFVCSEQGHESSECQLRHLSCSRCRRQGHVVEYCPQEVYDDGLNNEADVSFCRCLKCGEEGHINCCEVIPDASRFIFLQEPSPSEPSLREMGRQGSEDSPSWQPQQQGWNGYRGGWGFDDWSTAGPKAFFDLAPWLLQGAATGNFGWAPPPGDGGGYGGRNGGGGGWRNGNSKGWGGGGWGNGWGRSQSWDDGWSSQKRRRQNY